MSFLNIVEIIFAVLAAFVFVGVAPRFFFGLVIIGRNEIGVVTKKFSTKRGTTGRFIALDGEAGYQADTLSAGWFWGLYPWKYEVQHVAFTVVPAGEIALVISNDGDPIPSNRILGKNVNCNNFQDTRAFLSGGGEKGRQLGVLTAGTYKINPRAFTVITSRNAADNGVDPKLLSVLSISAEEVGIVTTLDGAPVQEGEIAGTPVEGHQNYQDAQAFLEAGGQRGLQEQVLLSGTWNINPWFARVERGRMTEIPIGYVGVVISYVGKEHIDISGDTFKHGDLVDRGHKGVWDAPLYPGKHPINARTAKVELVPTTNIALNWANNRSEAHKLDENLSSIKVRSKDGFSFTIDVAQIIHIGAKEASRVISRFGSMSNLVNQVLEPAIGNYFRNSAQNYSVLDFLSSRTERQTEAVKCIREALSGYDVEVVDTYLNDLVLPEVLLQTQTDRKIAQEQTATFKVQEETQKQRQSFMKEQALAEIQGQLVSSEQQVRMQEYQANAAIKKAEGDAQATKLRAQAEGEASRSKGEGEAAATEAVGLARAKAYKAGVDAMGQDNFGNLQVINSIGERGIQVTPNFLVTGGSGDGGGGTNGLLMSSLMAGILHRNAKELAQESETVARPVKTVTVPTNPTP